MADRITNIISKVANTKVSDSDYTGSIKQELAKSIDSRLDTQIQNTKDKIASEKNGDKDNKIIEEKAKKYKNEMEKDVSPYLKKRAKVIVSNLFDTDPDIQKAKNEAYDKYIDDFVSKTCEQIDNDAKSLEEYRIVIESVVRSCHDSINNDPELKKEINKQILTALQDAVVTETMNLMNSQQVNNLVLKENMYITKAGNLAKNLVNSTSFITSLQVDDLLKQYSKNASKNIAKSISDNTFGKLTKLPIIGPLFSPLQKATEKVVTESVKALFDKKMNTSWANDIKNIKAFQTRTAKFQQEANLAISKAEETAKTYTQKLEQKAINEIKKFINLDNLSIGGFKL